MRLIVFGGVCFGASCVMAKEIALTINQKRINIKRKLCRSKIKKSKKEVL